MTNTDNINTKPSTVDTIKEKAAHVVHKLTGKSDNTTNEERRVDDLNVRDHSNPLHTGAAASGAPIPHGNTVDRAAYQQQQTGVTGDHRDRHGVLGSAVEGGAAGAALTGAAVHHEHNKEREHGLPRDHHHALGAAAEGGAAGAALTGAAVHHEHNKEHRREEEAALRAGDQHRTQQYPGATGSLNAAPGTLQHPAPAGPTGTSNIPTYAQNIAPMAAGVVPTAVTTDSMTGTNVVPAMGAAGTTTAAGTHVPGGYDATNINTSGYDATNINRSGYDATNINPQQQQQQQQHIPGQYTTAEQQRHL